MDAAAEAVQRPAGATDPPWDKAGYEIARRLFDEVQKRSIGVEEMCAILKQDVELWKTTNDTSAVPPRGTQYPTPMASDYAACERCPDDLPLNRSVDLPGGGIGHYWPR